MFKTPPPTPPPPPPPRPAYTYVQVLPPKKKVVESLHSELPPADPETRPRSPSPSRKWKPPLPPPPPPPPEPQPEPEPEPEQELDGAADGMHVDDAGWEQDESRPGTGLAQDGRKKDDEEEEEEEGEDVSAYHDYDPSSGRMSPSFYDEEGELMVRMYCTAAHCAVLLTVLRCSLSCSLVRSLSVCLSVCLSVALCLSVCLSVCGSLSLRLHVHAVV